MLSIEDGVCTATVSKGKDEAKYTNQDCSCGAECRILYCPESPEKTGYGKSKLMNIDNLIMEHGNAFGCVPVRF